MFFFSKILNVPHKPFICRHINIYVSRNEGTENFSGLRTEKLSQSLGCSFNTARLMMQKVNLDHLDDSQFDGVTKFCKNYLKLSDVVEYPLVLSVPLNDLNHRLQTLNEIGCKDVRARYLLNFGKLMTYTPSKFKDIGVSLHLKNSIAAVLEQLHFPNDKKEIIQCEALDQYTKNCKLSSIKTLLTSEFLLWRFKSSKTEISNILRRNPKIPMQSITEIDALVEILMKTFNFSLKKILYNTHLLLLHSSTVVNLLEIVPNILSVNIQHFVRNCPKLLWRSPHTLKEINDILTEFGFSQQQLMQCTHIILLSPSVLRHNIESLLAHPELVLLKDEKLFLTFVCNHKNILKRLKTLKSSGQPSTFSAFMVSTARFRDIIKRSRCRSYGKDIVQHMSGMYGCSNKKVREQLSQYPNFYSSSVLGAHKVIAFLTSKGVSKDQLWNGLGIIAYEPEVVEQYFRNIYYNKEFQPISEWLGHFNFVQLLIYAINRNIYSPYNNEIETDINVEDDADDSDDNDSDDENLSDEEISEISEKN